MNDKSLATAQYLEENFDIYLEDLKTLAKIPSISFPGFPESELNRSAEAVAHLMRIRGLENVKILTVPGAPPYVYGDRIHAPGKPTLLLYAHHDVQPPGRESVWQTPPFQPTLKEGPGGLRLYGRGTADDKAGIIVHTSVVNAFLKTTGELPVNVKVVIEGEEEVGSNHLAQFLQAYQDELSADILVLTDSGNFDCGIPALTVALRGMIGIEVEVKSLSKTVHSGMWGGPIPDPVMGLSKMLATLVDEKGQIAVPGILDQVRPIDSTEKKELDRIPYSEADFRNQSGMLEKTEFLRTDPTPLVQTWRLPSLTVNAIQASSRTNKSNIINDTAWAKVTIRLVADMNPEKVLKLLTEHLLSKAPWGLEVEITPESSAAPWATDAKGTVFDIACRALEKGYGHAPYKIGCGGTIPFVKPFADALGGAPPLLIGVEDPYTNAHGENESVLISDLRKACVSQAHLFHELAETWKKA